MKMSENNKFPFEIKDLDGESLAEVKKFFTAPVTGYVLVGPDKYFYSRGFVTDAIKIYDMEVRPTDTFVLTFPKSGTTWAQELVWLLGNDLDYKAAKETNLVYRFPFIDFSVLFGDKESLPLIKEMFRNDEKTWRYFKMRDNSVLKTLEDIPRSSRRFMKCHLPLCFLPPNLLDTTKVVYVARDPRDVAVSYYHFAELFKLVGFKGDFKDFWHLFVHNLITWAPYFPHVLEAWNKRHHPNMLFVFYEELIKDLQGSIRRVADFLGKSVTEEQVERLSEHLRFDNFKKNPSVNYEPFREHGIFTEKSSFVRKGKAGGWRDYFDEEMTAQAQQWIDDNLRGTDLRFPTVNN